MVRKIITALILLAMLSTINAMPGLGAKHNFVWKKCYSTIPVPTVQANYPIPGQDLTVTVSGEVPDKSAKYTWSFSYVDFKGNHITYSYKGATVPLSPDSKHFTATGTAKVSDKLAEYDSYNLVVMVRREADKNHDKPT
ncbi:7657_t:CDS:1, partial [Paraglomus occultum]